jgi:hypothetical protein
MTIALNEPKYSIEPSDFRCVACSSEVAVDHSFFSAVFFEAEAFRRKSYCDPCWKKPSVAQDQAFAFWRSRRPPPNVSPRRIRFDADLILEFFRRLSAEPDPPPAPAASPEAAASAGGTPGAEPVAAAETTPEAGSGGSEGEKTRLRLVLALLLIRKKLLVYESSAARSGREWLKLSEKAEPARTHLVENPPLSDAQLEAVKVSLGDLLQMDLG